MKKLLLTLFAFIISVSSAHAINVLDGDPMYRPYAKHFVSQTSVKTGNGAGWNASIFNGYTVEEDFTYGVTDRFDIGVKTAGSFNTADPANSDTHVHQLSWDGFDVHASYRALDLCAFKMDVIGSVGRKFISPRGRDITTYGTDWGIGLRAGVVTRRFTIAASAMAHNFNSNLSHVEENIEGGSDIFSNTDFWYMSANVEGKYNFSDHINGVIGAEYDFDLTNKYSYFKTFADSDNNPLLMKAGVNINFDSTKFMGVYGTYNIAEAAPDKAWGVKATFGIDF